MKTIGNISNSNKLLMLLLFIVSCTTWMLSLSAVAEAASSRAAKPPRRKNDAYLLLAESIQHRLSLPTDSSSSEPKSTALGKYDIESIASALKTLSTSQAALKKIDGAAHEAYQRTHVSSTNLASAGEANDDEDAGGSSSVGGLKVAGRMSRNAARLGCVADALFAAELCELIRLYPPSTSTFEVDNKDDEIDCLGNSTSNKNEKENYDDALYGDEGTLAPHTERTVVLNTTIYPFLTANRSGKNNENFAISVLVIHEPNYNGGAGVGHGGVDDLLSFTKEELLEDDDGVAKEENISPRGRYLVILSGSYIDESDPIKSKGSNHLPSIISTLDVPPLRLTLRPELPHQNADEETASVCGPLYIAAGKVLEVVGPTLSKDCADAGKGVATKCGDEESESSGKNQMPESDDRKDSKSKDEPAIHFVAHSLAGGVAALACNILDGSLPMPGKSRKLKEDVEEPTHQTKSKKEPTENPNQWCGFGHDRSSALCLGPPPCLSSNIKSTFVTSVIHGDDVVCRTTYSTLERLCDRMRRTMKGGLFGKSVGWMSEAVSLTSEGLKSYAGEGKTKKEKLAVPGRAYLIRPRRMGGGSSSIHEVGSSSGGREALRAAVLWQLHDVLLSKSLWAHHSLEGYIRSLDRAQLRGFTEDASDQ